MSLFLPYEKMWDMPLGGTSDEKQVPHWAGNLIWGFLAFVFKICFRYRVDHRESLRGFKDKTGVVVVGNHTSFLDVAFMYLAGRPSQWVRFLGRENLFGNAHAEEQRDRGDHARGNPSRQKRSHARAALGSRVHREDGARAHPSHDRAQRRAREAQGRALPFPEDHHRVRRPRPRRRLRLPAEGRPLGRLLVVRHARVPHHTTAEVVAGIEAKAAAKAAKVQEVA